MTWTDCWPVFVLESNCRTSTVFCTTFMRINAEIDPKKLMLEAKVCYYTTQLLILPSKAFRTRETTGTKGKVSRQEHKKASPEWLPSPLARAVAFGWERVPRLTKQTNGVGQKSPAITCITSTVELQLFDHLKPWGLLKMLMSIPPNSPPLCSWDTHANNSYGAIMSVE